MNFESSGSNVSLNLGRRSKHIVVVDESKINARISSVGSDGINLGRASQRVCLLDDDNEDDATVDVGKNTRGAVLHLQGTTPVSSTTMRHTSTGSNGSTNSEVDEEQEEKSFIVQYLGVKETGRSFPAKGELTPAEFAELTATIASETFGKGKIKSSRFRFSSSNPIKCSIGPDYLRAIDLKSAEKALDLNMTNILSFKAAPMNNKSRSVKMDALLMARGSTPDTDEHIVCHRLQFKNHADIKDFFVTMKESFEREYRRVNQTATVPEEVNESLLFTSDC